jgi:hypothetical protein
VGGTRNWTGAGEGRAIDGIDDVDMDKGNQFCGIRRDDMEIWLGRGSNCAELITHSMQTQLRVNSLSLIYRFQMPVF